MKRFVLIMTSLMFCAVTSARTVTAQEQEETSVAIDNCLKAWGKHPFGEMPKYRTLPVTVKVFGIGTPNIDNGAHQQARSRAGESGRQCDGWNHCRAPQSQRLVLLRHERQRDGQDENQSGVHRASGSIT